jgi:hypothetical protein
MSFMHFMVNRITMKSMQDMKKTWRSKAATKAKDLIANSRE